MEVYILRALYLIPILFLFGCVSENEHNAVLQENEELKQEIIEKKELITELKKENKSLESELEITKMLLEKCNDQIYGDAYVLTRSGTSGYIRLEGYAEAVEYLKDCCY